MAPKKQLKSSSAPASHQTSPVASAKIPVLEGTTEMSTGMSMEEMLRNLMQTTQSIHAEVKQIQTEVKQIQTEVKQIQQDNLSFKLQLVEAQNNIVEIKQNVEVLEGRMGDFKEEVRGAKKDIKEVTENMLRLNLERMSLFLRFQNVAEKDGEELKDLMSQILADFLKMDKREIWKEIDMIYRINSAYARINKVPREIHIKFVRRSMREEILRVQRGGPLMYEQQEVLILKQIPKNIRELRRKYSFLSKKLYNKGIWFRWLIPEGMMIFWEGGRVRIKTVDEAKEFMRKHASVLGEEEGEVGGAMAPPGPGEGGSETMAQRLRSKT